jgi:hypothetical protein
MEAQHLIPPVKLTEKQADIVRWALEAMEPYWCDEEIARNREGICYDTMFLPKLEGLTFIYSTVEEIMEDLEDRLDQYYEMIGDYLNDTYGGSTLADYRSVTALKRKLFKEKA